MTAPVGDRIDEFERRVERERRSFDPPEDPDERAMEYVREGVGPAVVLYADCRTGGPDLPSAERDRLEGVLNDWLELYARCYGVEMECSFALHTAAEVLVETHNARDVAQLLTTVPPRH
ncbi:hypothetical protein [Haloarchaeobius sp. HRN-SO-5]|uniref:hypothetical protein n=1 Tax=Haloarchaeobius sp. HRN-SO-5 TaxID=3446118 RepID=UPI003EBF409F